MQFSRTQITSTLFCCLAVASVAQVKVAQPAEAPKQSALASEIKEDRRSVVIKVEIIRVQLNGDRDVETETLRGNVGARISSTGYSARNSMIRNIRASARDVRDGVIYLDLDYDESALGNRDTMDRQFSSTLAIKDGETVLAKAYKWDSRDAKGAENGGRSTTLEMLTHVTVNLVP